MPKVCQSAITAAISVFSDGTPELHCTFRVSFSLLVMPAPQSPVPVPGLVHTTEPLFIVQPLFVKNASAALMLKGYGAVNLADSDVGVDNGTALNVGTA